MQSAAENLQDELGDTGMVPEAVLMEEMKPGGKIPATEPSMDLGGGNLSLTCPTEGSSIVYQIKRGIGGAAGTYSPTRSNCPMAEIDPCKSLPVRLS